MRDEHKHSRFCREWAVRFGHPEGGEIRPRSEEPLRFRGATDAENRLLRILMCCFTRPSAASSCGTFAKSSATPIALPNAGASSSAPNPANCLPAQWNCNSVSQYCYGDTYAVPESDCICNALRPVAPSDCPAGTVFACHAATRTSDGHTLPQVVPFSCACVTDTNDCDAECTEAAPSSGTCTDVDSPNGRSVLCNCAVVVLR